jgi:hypothetical protein
MQRFSPESLEGLRRCLRPEYAGMPGEDLKQVVESSLSALPAEAAEDFLKSLGSLGKAVAPALQRAAPGIAQGAATGASVGGPWGALIGAGAGAASSFLGGGPARPTGPAPAAAPSTSPSAVAALPTGQGAAATFLGLMQNPAVQQALLSQVLGASGGQQVAAPSGTSMPRGAINALLTQLLANASEALPEAESITEQDYLRGESGEFLVDPASPEQQAALVLSHLRRAPPAGTQGESADFAESTEWIVEELGEAESAQWPESDESVEAAQFY